jgi:hypothetical protein
METLTCLWRAALPLEMMRRESQLSRIPLTIARRCTKIGAPLREEDLSCQDHAKRSLPLHCRLGRQSTYSTDSLASVGSLPEKSTATSTKCTARSAASNSSWSACAPPSAAAEPPPRCAAAVPPAPAVLRGVPAVPPAPAVPVVRPAAVPAVPAPLPRTVDRPGRARVAGLAAAVPPLRPSSSHPVSFRAATSGSSGRSRATSGRRISARPRKRAARQPSGK